MQQLIILIVALALAGGVYLFLTISKKKNKEQTEENAVEMMTANEMINVKDIRNNCLEKIMSISTLPTPFTHLKISKNNYISLTISLSALLIGKLLLLSLRFVWLPVKFFSIL